MKSLFWNSHIILQLLAKENLFLGKEIFVKKLTYYVRLERMSRLDGSPLGVSVRNQAGELNTFFVCQEDGKTALEIPTRLFQHLRDLEAVYNVAILWDYESFAAWVETPHLPANA